jgi:uncharacterized protein YbaP (TraB family)
MFKLFRSILLGTTLGLASPSIAQTAPAPAPTAKLPDTDPALWVVKDADTTVYLFGTFHALDGKTDWFNDEVRSAYDRSGKVYLEIIQPEDKAAVAPLMQKYALATDAAKKDGKPVDQLETLEFQMSMFDSLPEAEQIKLLEYGAATMKETPALFARMTKLWNDGDAEGFATLINEMQSQSPALHEMLLARRNATWAKWIENRLKTPGTVFVAVGAGHLAGKDSVQDYLAKTGIKTARVKY